MPMPGRSFTQNPHQRCQRGHVQPAMTQSDRNCASAQFKPGEPCSAFRFDRSEVDLQMPIGLEPLHGLPQHHSMRCQFASLGSGPPYQISGAGSMKCKKHRRHRARALVRDEHARRCGALLCQGQGQSDGVAAIAPHPPLRQLFAQEPMQRINGQGAVPYG